jgi:hypothetical protein
MTKAPAILDDTEMMTLAIVIEVEPVLKKMTTSTYIDDVICDLLRYDTTGTVTLRASSEADAGDEVADRALRRVIREKIHRCEKLSPFLETYAAKVLERGPIPRGRGGAKYGGWGRDFGIVVLVFIACCRFKLKPTRNPEQKRRKQPSGSSIVAAALAYYGIKIKEKTVENIWGTLQVHLGRFLVAAGCGVPT